MGKFKIADFEFIKLSRALPQPTKRITREIRSGVSGVTWWDTGRRGVPFTLVSVVNCVDVNAAQDLFREYQNKKDAFVPVTAEWDGVNPDPVRLMILDVDVIDEGLYATLLGIGGVVSPSNAMLHCRWEVEPLELS